MLGRPRQTADKDDSGKLTDAYKKLSVEGKGKALDYVRRLLELEKIRGGPPAAVVGRRAPPAEAAQRVVVGGGRGSGRGAPSRQRLRAVRIVDTADSVDDIVGRVFPRSPHPGQAQQQNYQHSPEYDPSRDSGYPPQSAPPPITQHQGGYHGQPQHPPATGASGAYRPSQQPQHGQGYGNQGGSYGQEVPGLNGAVQYSQHHTPQLQEWGQAQPAQHQPYAPPQQHYQQPWFQPQQQPQQQQQNSNQQQQQQQNSNQQQQQPYHPTNLQYASPPPPQLYPAQQQQNMGGWQCPASVETGEAEQPIPVSIPTTPPRPRSYGG